MEIIVGVSRTLSFLNKKPGDKNFWCVSGKSSSVRPNDLLLLYFPRSISTTKDGIGQIYRIISEPEKTQTSMCHHYGMVEVQTELLANLSKHIKMQAMKANEILRDWGAVRRSMQGVTFVIDGEEWVALRSIIVANNPEVRSFLEAKLEKEVK